MLFPIEVKGNYINIPDLNLREGHARLRTAVLDGEIPVTMPIGFSLNTPRNSSFISAVDRNRSCQESMLAIAANVSNIILTGNMAQIVTIEEQVGRVTTGNAVWRSGGVHECGPINPDQHMFTAIEPMSINFLVHKSSGYHSMADNAAIVGDASYFTLATVHTLIDYIRVLPLVRGVIEVRYYNGMTPELFQRIWNEAL